MKIHELNVPSVVKALNEVSKDDIPRIVEVLLDEVYDSDSGSFVFARLFDHKIVFIADLDDSLSDREIDKQISVFEDDLCMSAARVLEDPTIEDHLLTGDF